MATLREFSVRIKRVAGRVPERADVMTRRVLLACAATVVLRTPVDTGRARANWQAQVGQPAQGTLPEPSSPAQGPAAALARAQAVAAAYRGEKSLHLTNNLPYISALNRGSSSQAPANFVQAAIAAALQAIRAARLT